MMNPHERIILAYDNLTLHEAESLTKSVGKRAYAVKIHALFDAWGNDAVRRLQQAGAQRVWVDAKLHDIPTTVGLRARKITDSGATIVSVHASGGRDMVAEAAIQGQRDVFAITVLTSLARQEVRDIYGREPIDQSIFLAGVAYAGGAAGIVCSAQEVSTLSKIPELEGMKFIVPGTRRKGSKTHDQQRTGTPEQAIRDGATHLVIGREVTEASNPIEAFEAIVEAIRTGGYQ